MQGDDCGSYRRGMYATSITSPKLKSNTDFDTNPPLPSAPSQHVSIIVVQLEIDKYDQAITKPASSSYLLHQDAHLQLKQGENCVCTGLLYSNPDRSVCLIVILYFHVAIVKGFIVRKASCGESEKTSILIFSLFRSPRCARLLSFVKLLVVFWFCITLMYISPVVDALCFCVLICCRTLCCLLECG